MDDNCPFRRRGFIHFHVIFSVLTSKFDNVLIFVMENMKKPTSLAIKVWEHKKMGAGQITISRVRD